MNLWDILFGIETFETDFKRGQSPALFSYADPKVKKVVFALKNGSREAARVIAHAMRPHIPENTIVVPIPASYARGFNQCALVSRHFTSAEILFRKNKTSQKSLDRKSRLSNVSLYAKIPRDMLGRDFCIIDDVMTTGATLREAQKILLQSGARSVTILAFAH